MDAELKTVVSNLAQQYGAERVYLFGSYARGEETEASDIDLRIDKGSIRGLQFARLLGDLEDTLGKKIDLISTSGMDEEFRKAIAPEEVLLYERQ
ncbi:MAG: nucleotidyltransferase domain-containing protein [Fretibacterium sp.]|nr:nucleotidyltransferase domain-containing protein [Fretibacterium sp.]